MRSCSQASPTHVLKGRHHPWLRLLFPPSTYLSILSWLLVPKTGQANHINKFKQGTCFQLETYSTRFCLLPSHQEHQWHLEKGIFTLSLFRAGDSPRWVAVCLWVGRHLPASLTPRGLAPSEGAMFLPLPSPQFLTPAMENASSRTFRRLGERLRRAYVCCPCSCLHSSPELGKKN